MTGPSLLYCVVSTTFWTATQVYLVGGSPFPPFYASNTHPPMTRRAINLLPNPELRRHLAPDLRAHADTVEEWFERLETVGRLAARQLSVDRAVQAATRDDDTWMLVSDTHFARVPDSAFTKVDTKRSPYAG